MRCKSVNIYIKNDFFDNLKREGRPSRFLLPQAGIVG